ncbi:glyoxalase superfamily protein [Pseudactinotalea sp. Z1732]|uniref:glyoxalase superfamily protein n=1 Tax=Micrococcales TaxID=85006 RepID=UPI003C7A6DFA
MNTTTDAGAGLGHPVPVLRMFDEGAAARFYQDFLGFTVLWDHRFEPGLPLYRRLRRDQMVLDLSEHHGDGTPGTVVWVPVADVATLHADLSATSYSAQLPAVEPDAAGGPTLSVTDPFGNVLRFCQPQT